MGESHEMLRGPRPPTLNTWQRGTLSAGWLLCDKSPFVLAGERISSLQLLQLKKCWFKRPCPREAREQAQFQLHFR